MPSEIGGKRFASQFRSMIQDEVSKAFEAGRAHIKAATDELTAEIHHQSTAAARVIRQEVQHLRDGFSDYTGNAAPDEEAPEPPRAPIEAADPVKAAADRAEAAAAQAAAAAGALPPVSPIQAAEPQSASVEPPLPPGMPVSGGPI